MGKTIAQKDAHAVKDGIRPAVGDTTKAYLVFFPNSKTCYVVFSPEKLWCDPVQLQHQVPEKVPEGSGAFRCRLLMRFRRVPVHMADEVPDSSGADEVVEGSGADGSGQKTDEVLDGSGVDG